MIDHMIHPRLLPYLWELEEIEKRAHKRYAYSTPIYVQYLFEHYTRHWRQLQEQHMHEIKEKMWNELYFVFNLRLREIPRCRFDMQYLTFEIDGEPLFHDEHTLRPFWR